VASTLRPRRGPLASRGDSPTDETYAARSRRRSDERRLSFPSPRFFETRRDRERSERERFLRSSSKCPLWADVIIRRHFVLRR